MNHQELASLWESELRSRFSDRARDFPVRVSSGGEVSYVNLDHAATTIPFAEVKSYVDGWFDGYGSVHRGSGQKSQQTTAQFDATRDRVRRYLKASPDQYVIYTKNTTEAINHAALLWASRPGTVLVSDIEHSSNLLPWVRHNCVVQYRTRQDGVVQLDEIEKMLAAQASLGADQQCKLVTFTACSNITGYCPPIYDIARLAHRYGAMVFADMCQLIPHEPVDARPVADPAHLDFIAFSGHKMYAPYGIGVLLGPKPFFDEQMPCHIGGGNLPYITRDLKMKRYLTERAHDPGTPNAVGPIALSKAMDVMEAIGLDRIAEYESGLVRYAFDRMSEVPGIRLYPSRDRLGHVIPFDVDGFDPRLLATALAHEYGIGIRAGAFCTYEYIRKLKFISDAEDQRIADEIDRGVVANVPHVARVSFSICNPVSDVTRLVSALVELVDRGVARVRSGYSQDPQLGSWQPTASADRTGALLP